MELFDVIIIAVTLWSVIGFFIFGKTEAKCHNPVVWKYAVMTFCSGPLIWAGMAMGFTIDLIENITIFDGLIERISRWVNDEKVEADG